VPDARTMKLVLVVLLVPVVLLVLLVLVLVLALALAALAALELALLLLLLPLPLLLLKLPRLLPRLVAVIWASAARVIVDQMDRQVVLEPTELPVLTVWMASREIAVHQLHPAR